MRLVLSSLEKKYYVLHSGFFSECVSVVSCHDPGIEVTRWFDQRGRVCSWFCHLFFYKGY